MAQNTSLPPTVHRARIGEEVVAREGQWITQRNGSSAQRFGCETARLFRATHIARFPNCRPTPTAKDTRWWRFAAKPFQIALPTTTAMDCVTSKRWLSSG